MVGLWVSRKVEKMPANELNDLINEDSAEGDHPLQFLDGDDWKNNQQALSNYLKRRYYETDGHYEVMPMSWAADSLNVKAWLSGHIKIGYNAEYTPSQRFLNVYDHWRGLHGDADAEVMTKYKSRLSIGYHPCMINELDRQIQKYQDGIGKVLELIAPYKVEIEEIYYKNLELDAQMVKAMKVGPHTHEFISEHKSSHFKSGFRWPQAEDDELVRKCERCKTIFQYFVEHPESGKLSDGESLAIDVKSQNIAGRIRSEGIEDWKQSYQTGEVSRQRRILWNSDTAISAFLEDPNYWYEQAVKISLDQFGLNDLVECSVSAGAKLYGELADNENTSAQFDVSGYDGFLVHLSNESSVCTPCGIPQLGSGHGKTSSKGTSNHPVMIRANIDNTGKEPEIIKIQGDDAGMKYDPIKFDPKEWEIPGVYEIDPEGSALDVFLGMCIKDPQYIHPVGFKPTVERPGQAVKVELGLSTGPLAWTNSEQEMDIIMNVYKGLGPDGETPLREYLDKIEMPKDGYLKGDVIVNILSQTQEQEEEEPNGGT